MAFFVIGVNAVLISITPRVVLLLGCKLARTIIGSFTFMCLSNYLILHGFATRKTQREIANHSQAQRGNVNFFLLNNHKVHIE